MTDETAAVSQSDDLLRVWREAGGTADGVIVHAAGEIDLSSAPKLDEVLHEVADRMSAPGHVVLDLTKVTFLGSVGLSLLVRYDEQLRSAGGSLRVVTGNRFVARAISMTGLVDLLTLFDTLDEAVTAAS